MKSLRDLPSVDVFLQSTQASAWIASYGRPLTLQAIRQTLQDLRDHYNKDKPLPDVETIYGQVSLKLASWTSPSLVPVINASGVILHTNLGRAPLSQAAINAAQEAALGYSNLEYDLEKGKRGSRLIHAERLLKHLSGAQSALVVNNNASAVLLILTALSRRRSVVIARSQLVEIGGGFRVPDVMKQSGARLVEIGATNRVHLSDYEQAITQEHPALVMRAHRSNFRIIGFTSEPSLSEIAEVAHRADIPLIDDLGSGTFLDTACYGMAHEPTIDESLAGGADLVSFSGDKLLGGPQAGIILGRLDLVEKLKKHPLARAIRADKICLAALSATLLHYMKDEVVKEVPIWRMIAQTSEEIRNRAQNWVDRLGHGEVLATQSTVGGGSLPGETLPTFALALTLPSPNRFLEKLHHSSPPVIARLEDGRILFDPRTVLPSQDASLLSVLDSCLS